MRRPERHRASRAPRVAAVLAALLLAGGCERYPRDPEGTLERVAGGELQAGIAHSPPHASHGSEPTGVEAELLRGLAERLDARIVWHRAGEQALMQRLERHELDVVVGGITAKTPWRRRVALSVPYARSRDAHGNEVEHVLALPPGENAWRLEVERFLRTARDDGEVETPR